MVAKPYTVLPYHRLPGVLLLEIKLQVCFFNYPARDGELLAIHIHYHNAVLKSGKFSPEGFSVFNKGPGSNEYDFSNKSLKISLFF